jgi:hypothetical protein
LAGVRVASSVVRVTPDERVSVAVSVKMPGGVAVMAMILLPVLTADWVALNRVLKRQAAGVLAPLGKGTALLLSLPATGST